MAVIFVLGVLLAHAIITIERVNTELFECQQHAGDNQ